MKQKHIEALTKENKHITLYSYKAFTHFGWQRSSRYFFWSEISSSALKYKCKIHHNITKAHRHVYDINMYNEQD